MKKFIKINCIILVIFCLIINLNVFATSIEESQEKTLDDLQTEKSQLENSINESNSQIQIIESDLSTTVAEIALINQQICDKQLEIETLEAQEVALLAYIEKAEKEYEKSTQRFDKQKELLETRLVAMYEMGETSYLDILLNSKGIT